MTASETVGVSVPRIQGLQRVAGREYRDIVEKGFPHLLQAAKDYKVEALKRAALKG
jgi:hypothetical protein